MDVEAGVRLGRILAEEGIDTIVACGLQSEHCVSNTSFSALELKFTVYVVEDAHSTWPTEHESAPTIIQRQNQALADQGAKVESTSNLIALLKS